mmetsp:Transcript_66443/g.210286  ORF Transcript_66443/g.210286 Transcript_66443/m.210286 type:complete len:239 (+) Transcript_66443:146-862(+)
MHGLGGSQHQLAENEQKDDRNEQHSHAPRRARPAQPLADADGGSPGIKASNFARRPLICRQVANPAERPPLAQATVQQHHPLPPRIGFVQEQRRQRARHLVGEGHEDKEEGDVHASLLGTPQGPEHRGLQRPQQVWVEHVGKVGVLPQPRQQGQAACRGHDELRDDGRQHHDQTHRLPRSRREVLGHRRDRRACMRQQLPPQLHCLGCSAVPQVHAARKECRAIHLPGEEGEASSAHP